MYSAIVSMRTYVSFQNVKNAVPKCMYRHVLSTYWYIPFSDPKVQYVLGTYFLSKVCTRKHTFNTKYVLVHTGTYRYILEVKSMYPVHTWGTTSHGSKKSRSMNLVQTCLCPFISVPYHSMVHTGTYRYELGTCYWSGFQIMYIHFYGYTRLHGILSDIQRTV